jgi:hypothetical protein
MIRAATPILRQRATPLDHARSGVNHEDAHLPLAAEPAVSLIEGDMPVRRLVQAVLEAAG